MSDILSSHSSLQISSLSLTQHSALCDLVTAREIVYDVRVEVRAKKKFGLIVILPKKKREDTQKVRWRVCGCEKRALERKLKGPLSKAVGNEHLRSWKKK